MNCCTFLAAVAPLLAMVAPASAQGPLGNSLTSDPSTPLGGRFRAGNTPVVSAAGSPAGTTTGSATDAKKAKGPTEITSREAMLDNRINLATFSGEVEVKDPEYQITCDKLTVYLRKEKGKVEPKATGPKPIGADEEPPKPAADPKESGGGGIEKAVAEGNVIIIQDKIDADGKKQRYYGKARKAIFDQDKKTCVLYGWPRISQSLNESLGKEVIAKQESTVITLDQAGVIKVDGPNTVRLSDVDALEQKPGAR